MVNQSFKKEARRQNKFEFLENSRPRCNFCGQQNWQCLTRYDIDNPDDENFFVIECMKCRKKRCGRRKSSRLSRRSNVTYLACTCCGDDQCYLEDNHLYCFGGKEICVPKCANCHALVTDAQIDHGQFPRKARNLDEARRLFILNVKETTKLMIQFHAPRLIVDEFRCMAEKEASCLGVPALLVSNLFLRL